MKILLHDKQKGLSELVTAIVAATTFVIANWDTIKTWLSWLGDIADYDPTKGREPQRIESLVKAWYNKNAFKYILPDGTLSSVGIANIGSMGCDSLKTYKTQLQRGPLQYLGDEKNYKPNTVKRVIHRHVAAMAAVIEMVNKEIQKKCGSGGSQITNSRPPITYKYFKAKNNTSYLAPIADPRTGRRAVVNVSKGQVIAVPSNLVGIYNLPAGDFAETDENGQLIGSSLPAGLVFSTILAFGALTDL